MFHVVLYQPEIPPNTGNVIRLCANVGANLHLIEPLGFELDAARVRRAGLDYHELTRVRVWQSFDDCLAETRIERWYAVSTRATRRYDSVEIARGAAVVFGPETRGLPAEILARCPPEQSLQIPMMPGNRSLNLSNSVAVVIYEAWRRYGFEGAGPGRGVGVSGT
jgi:tRNA (cytidine/uridine-2'-O-)-methyltransferase